MIDPNAAAQAWVNGMQSAGAKITAGVNAVTVPPGQAAARQAAVWASNTAAAQAKYAKNVAAVSLEEWKQAVLTKGVNRVGTGAAAAQNKMANAMTQILPQIANIVSSLPPRGDLGANINRMVDYAQKASKITYNR